MICFCEMFVDDFEEVFEGCFFDNVLVNIYDDDIWGSIFGCFEII